MLMFYRVIVFYALTQRRAAAQQHSYQLQAETRSTQTNSQDYYNDASDDQKLYIKLIISYEMFMTATTINIYLLL